MKTLRKIAMGTLVAVIAGAGAGCEPKTRKAKPDTVRLESSSPQVSADVGVLSVRVILYQQGVRLHDFPVRLTLALTDSAGNPVIVTQAPVLTTDLLGETTYSYADLRTASSGTVLAEALKKDGETPVLDGDVPVAATLAVAVLPGAAAVVNATLLPTPAVILPGDPVTVSVTVRDAWDNATNAPVQIDTDAPGALVIGDVLTGLETAGDYTVVASVLGTALSDTEPLTVGPGTAASVALTVSQSAIRAGTALSVSAQVFDEFGNEVPAGQAPATFDVVGLSGEVFTATTANAGTFTAVNAAGSYTVRAVLGGLNPPEDVEPLLVSPAPAASITLVTSTASIAPMESLTATTTVRDAFTNVTSDLVAVTVNAPGASITGALGAWTLGGIGQAGSYSVVASVVGVPITDSELLTVTPGAGATIDLVLDSPVWDAGQTVTGMARVYDAQGNEVTPPPTIVATTDIPGATPGASGGAITVTSVARTGSFTVTATILGTGIADPESLTIQDVTVPTISFTGLVADQSVGMGLSYPLTVSAGDSVGVAKIEGYVTTGGELDGFGPIGGVPSFVQFYPNNSIGASALPVFTVAGGTPTRTPIQITFQATDMAGNVSNVTRQVFVDPAADLVPSLAAGLVARTVAEDDDPAGVTGGIRTDGIDCTVVGVDTIVAVPDRANGSLYAFTVPAVGTFHSFGTGGTFVDLVDAGLSGPRGAEYSPIGDLYVLEDGGADRLLRYPAGGGPSIQVNTGAQAFNVGRHLESQAQGATTFLFAVEQGVGNGVVRRYDITTPPTGTISLGAGDLAFATGNGNSNGNLWGITAGATNLFLTARGADVTQRASATAGGAISDYVTTGVFRPQGTDLAPGTLPRFASEVFTASNANGGGQLSPINRVDQTTAASAATFAHGLELATDAAFCGGNLYLAYDRGPFDARIVEISGF